MVSTVALEQWWGEEQGAAPKTSNLPLGLGHSNLPPSWDAVCTRQVINKLVNNDRSNESNDAKLNQDDHFCFMALAGPGAASSEGFPAGAAGLDSGSSVYLRHTDDSKIGITSSFRQGDGSRVSCRISIGPGGIPIANVKKKKGRAKFRRLADGLVS